MANASMEAAAAPSRHDSAAWVARVERGGVFESLHRGHVAVARRNGTVVAALGNPRALTYVRSAIKPVQAAAALCLTEGSGATLPPRGVAIACASHCGTGTQQAEVARVLQSAGLDANARAVRRPCPRTPPRSSRSPGVPAGWNGPDGPLGVAVKVLDGADRAAGAVAAAVLHSLGAPTPERLLTPLRLPDDRGEATLEVTGVVQLVM